MIDLRNKAARAMHSGNGARCRSELDRTERDGNQNATDEVPMPDNRHTLAVKRYAADSPWRTSALVKGQSLRMSSGRDCRTCATWPGST